MDLHKFRNTKAQLNLMAEYYRQQELPLNARKMLLHVLNSAEQRINQGRSPVISIASTFLRKHFGRYDSSNEPLISKGILRITGYSRYKNLCRSYIPARDILDPFLRAGSEDGCSIELGRTPVNEGVTLLCQFDREAVEAHLAAMPRETFTDLRRFKLDHYHLARVVREDRAALAGGRVWAYQPIYVQQSAGRFSEVLGGFQGCSREMKHAAFSSLPDVKNLDLVRSHASVVLQLLRDAGHSHEALDLLEAFNADAGLFDEFVSNTGLPKRLVKLVMHSLFNGAFLPRAFPARAIAELGPEEDHDTSKLFPAMLEEASAERLRQCWTDLYSTLYPFKQLRDVWLGYLVKEWVPAHCTKYGTPMLKNASGVRTPLSEFQKGTRIAKFGQLASFVLQGHEAAFVQRFIAEAPRFGVVPMSDQHDGAVVRLDPGARLDELIAFCKEQTGWQYARLVEKPYL